MRLKAEKVAAEARLKVMRAEEEAQPDQLDAPEPSAQEAADSQRRRAWQQLQCARPSFFTTADPVKLQAAIDLAIEAGVELNDVADAQAELKKLLQERLVARETEREKAARRLSTLAAAEGGRGAGSAADDSPLAALARAAAEVVALLGQTAAKCALEQPKHSVKWGASPVRYSRSSGFPGVTPQRESPTSVDAYPVCEYGGDEHQQAAEAKAATALASKAPPVDGCMGLFAVWAAGVGALLCGQQRIEAY